MIPGYIAPTIITGPDQSGKTDALLAKVANIVGHGGRKGYLYFPHPNRQWVLMQRLLSQLAYPEQRDFLRPNVSSMSDFPLELATDDGMEPKAFFFFDMTIADPLAGHLITQPLQFHSPVYAEVSFLDRVVLHSTTRL